MPYSNIEGVPKSLKTAGLNLEQANDWARYYDEAKKQPEITSAAAIAWKSFKQKYYKTGTKWRVKRIKAENKRKPLFNPVIKPNTINKEDVMSNENKIKGYELVYRSSPKPVSLEDVDAEGRTYEKELIREGEWAHPQRSSVRLKITLDRMKKWVANFNKQLFKVPVPKRHSLDPEDNRGWLKKVFLKENKEGKQVLYGHLDITNDKMQKLIDNGDVQDVSVSVGEYRDNKGKRHGEALQHVALTVIPHIDSQSGFSPIDAEGYICLEEVKEMKKKEVDNELEEVEQNVLNLQAPDGSSEQEKEDITNAIITARLFAEEKNFVIIGTYDLKVILQYFGGGEGIGSDSGQPVNDRFFEVPYTKDLKGSYIFGDKKELAKRFYFVPKEAIKEPTVAAEKDVEKEKQNKEVSEMKEFEALQTQHAELEKEKVDLETKIAEMEPKIVELEKAKTELEESNKGMKEQLDKIEADKKVAFEKGVEEKVSKLLEDGNILPAEKDDVTAVILEGGKAAEMLEKTLKDRKAVDLETKTKQGSEKPSGDEGLTQKKIEAEAERISKGEAPSK